MDLPNAVTVIIAKGEGRAVFGSSTVAWQWREPQQSRNQHRLVELVGELHDTEFETYRRRSPPKTQWESLGSSWKGLDAADMKSEPKPRPADGVAE